MIYSELASIAFYITLDVAPIGADIAPMSNGETEMRYYCEFS